MVLVISKNLQSLSLQPRISFFFFFITRTIFLTVSQNNLVNKIPWFVTHGVDAMCVEGSHDGVERTLIPDSETRLVEHDFSRGPWWPEKTYDAIWCVEFLEHVSFQLEYLVLGSTSQLTNFLPL